MSQISPIEHQVAAVRRKMILQDFLRALAVALLVLGGVAWVTALVLRLFAMELPGGGWLWLVGGVAVAAIAAFVWALHKAPTAHEAAVAIDERLGLKEKFSTALVIAGDSDPFAQLAVADALRTSGHVDLRRKFPLAWPRTFVGVPVWALLILLTLWLVPALQWAKEAQAADLDQKQQEQQAQQEAERIIQQTTNALAVLPQEVADREEFRIARDRLAQAREALMRDPATARQTAKEAQKEVAQALKEQIERGEKYAQAKENARAFRNLNPTQDEKGPVADAHRAMANADFQKAMEELQKAVENFEKATQEEKQQQAQQMQQLANALQQMANNEQQQQQTEQQLQQLGMDKQQAQQMQNLMQQAAQGNQQAAQQLQQMAQQAMQQMNNGQGPSQQQQQQVQQMMNQMQQQAGSQAMAQQMQQAAQQMAQAMQQAAQQQSSQQASQQQSGSQGQQAQAGNSAQQQASSGQMASAGQGLQDALSQMQAMQQNAQQMQAAAGMCEGGGEGDGQKSSQMAGSGKWKPGDSTDEGAGLGGAGRGEGGQAPYGAAPFGMKQEVSKSHDNEDGRVIASTLIKSESLKGESKAEIQKIAESETKEATDEVDQQRVSRQAQRAVREYFQSMAKDAGNAPPAEGERKPAQEPAKSSGN